MFSLFYLIFVIPRYLYVDFENEELGCTNQQQFSAGGAGALPIYWDKVGIVDNITHTLPIYWDSVHIHPSQYLLHQRVSEHN